MKTNVLILAASVCFTTTAIQAQSNGCAALPDQQRLKAALIAARAAESSGLNANVSPRCTRYRYGKGGGVKDFDWTHDSSQSSRFGEMKTASIPDFSRICRMMVRRIASVSAIRGAGCAP